MTEHYAACRYTPNLCCLVPPSEPTYDGVGTLTSNKAYIKSTRDVSNPHECKFTERSRRQSGAPMKLSTESSSSSRPSAEDVRPMSQCPACGRADGGHSVDCQIVLRRAASVDAGTPTSAEDVRPDVADAREHPAVEWLNGSEPNPLPRSSVATTAPLREGVGRGGEGPDVAGLLAEVAEAGVWHNVTKMDREQISSLFRRCRAMIETLAGERDRFRAVLEGAEYEHIDDLRGKSIDFCRALGVMAATETRELAEYRADAERYRWLRDNIEIGSSASGLDRWSIDLPDPGIKLDAGEVFDAAIDAAIDAARGASTKEVDRADRA